jgi:hypothetical protein
MKLKSLFAMAALTVAVGFSLSATSVDAQGRRGNRNGGQGNQNGAGAGFGAGAQGGFNPMQMMMGGNGSIIDPARTAKNTLVYRPEVQNALALDLRQKNALDALKGVQAQNQQKMGQDIATTVRSQFGQGQTMTPEERQQKMQEMGDKVKGIAQGYQDDLDKRIDEILTPRQRKRLGEIDLRWRGPMAFVDPKVAEQAALGADDKKKAQDAYKEFSDARQALVTSMLPAGIRARFNAAAVAASPPTTADGEVAITVTPPATAAQPTVQPSAPLSPAEQQLAQKKALRDFEKKRVALGTKLVGNVTPAAASAWQTLIGAPFTFRDND